jgi:molybdate transport system substrate-binding protein
VLGLLTGMIGLIAAGVSPTGAQAPARGIAVAAASDLQTVLPEVARRFQRDTGAAVKVSLGSSGNFFAQIQNGAPFDVFLSADIEYPRQLAASGHADANSLYEYATGRIVLWTRNDTGIDVRRGLAAVRDARVRRIAIANPEHAPYGRAAVAALRHDQLYDAVQSKFVLGENISQAAQFVESGNADLGIIALSLALGPALRSSGTYFQIPSTAHPPIQQAAIIMSTSKNKETALQFLAYLKRPEIKHVLDGLGFNAPRAAAR